MWIAISIGCNKENPRVLTVAESAHSIRQKLISLFFKNEKIQECEPWTDIRTERFSFQNVGIPYLYNICVFYVEDDNIYSLVESIMNSECFRLIKQ